MRVTIIPKNCYKKRFYRRNLVIYKKEKQMITNILIGLFFFCIGFSVGTKLTFDFITSDLDDGSGDKR